MSTGTDWARGKEEKAKISARIKENREQQSIKTKQPDIRGKAFAEEQIHELNKEEEIKKGKVWKS